MEFALHLNWIGFVIVAFHGKFFSFWIAIVTELAITVLESERRTPISTRTVLVSRISHRYTHNQFLATLLWVCLMAWMDVGEVWPSACAHTPCAPHTNRIRLKGVEQSGVVDGGGGWHFVFTPHKLTKIHSVTHEENTQSLSDQIIRIRPCSRNVLLFGSKC